MNDAGRSAARDAARHLSNRTNGNGKPILAAPLTISGEATPTRAASGAGVGRTVAGNARDRRESGAAPDRARCAAEKEAGR